MTTSVAGIVRRWAQASPDAPALTGHGPDGAVTTRTWSEVDARSNAVAHGLRAEGVLRGGRIALLDKNGLAFFDVLFGAAKAGAVTVAVNWRLAPPEILQILEDSEATVVFVGCDLVGALDAIRDRLTAVRRIIVVDGGRAGHESLAGWLASQPTDDPGGEADATDVVMQLYTSGTTGIPKGVMLTNGNWAAAIPQLAGEMGLTSSSVSMAAMPLFHVGGSGWAIVGLAHGCHTVVVREVDPALVLRTIADRSISHAFLVPAVLQFMLADPGVGSARLGSLHTVAYGASPISEDVLRRCLETFRCRFAQVYGMTETTGAITILRPAEHETAAGHAERLRSCGVPLGGVDIRVVDPETGLDLADGVVGELWTRSAQNMVGYWRKPEETERTIDREGWLRTGDAGYWSDGYLYLHDRMKDLIISGGENIYPAEVENVLMSHAQVADAAVIGVPDERWGETVKAVVVAGPGPALDGGELIAWCRARLAHYKCPTSVDLVAALPRNPSGKILKRELRAPYWAGRERRIS
jgi:long-chain acyl-CoA synthetase